MWSFSSTGCKYKGLVNQGSTCYLNSVLQVLFMTREFREAVERHGCDNGSLDFHLKKLFKDLKNDTCDTYSITKQLGISPGYVQRDAAECLENILSRLTSEASEIFKGTLTLKTKCSECKTETSSNDPFWNLPLEMENCDKDYNLADGIIKFFSKSELSGPDQLYCERCATKSDATTVHLKVLTDAVQQMQRDTFRGMMEVWDELHQICGWGLCVLCKGHEVEERQVGEECYSAVQCCAGHHKPVLFCTPCWGGTAACPRCIQLPPPAFEEADATQQHMHNHGPH